MSSSVPKSFVDSLATDLHVAAALKLVPRPPDPWPAAHRKVREAEFALLRVSSYDLADKARFQERQLRDLIERQAAAKLQGHLDIAAELQGTIDRLTKMVEASKALVEAIPEEAQRLATRSKRLAHRQALDTFQATLRRRTENEGYKMTAEDGQVMLDLAAAVEADNAAQQHEVAEMKRLLAAADEAKVEARQVLIDAMLVQVQQQAREAAKVLGVKAALYRAYPSTTPPEFLHCYNRAVSASVASRALGQGHSPLDEFHARLDADGCALIDDFTNQWHRAALKVAAAKG